MAITLNETFIVNADIDTLWAFILSPENIARCMPGASIDEIIDQRQFSGRVKVSIGAISARYRGTITYAVTDRDSGRIEMRAQAADDKSCGTVDGSITTELRALSRAKTELSCHSEIDLTGRLVAVGRGMIEGVAGEIIGQFIDNVRREVETEVPTTEPPKPPNLLLIVLKVMYTRIASKLRHLLRRKPIAEATK